MDVPSPREAASEIKTGFLTGIASRVIIFRYLSVSQGHRVSDPCGFYHPVSPLCLRSLPILALVQLTHLCRTSHQTSVPSSNKQGPVPASENRHNQEVLLHPRVTALHHFPVQHAMCWSFTRSCSASTWDTLWTVAALAAQGSGGFSECSYKADGLLHKLQQRFPPSPVHGCFGRCRGEAEVFLPPLTVAVVVPREWGNSFLHMLGLVTCRSV